MKPLNKIWQAWKRLGQIMGTVLAHVVLTLFYFTLFLPYALVITLFSDPLHIRQPKPVWDAREAAGAPTGEPSIAAARRQF